MKTNNIGIKGIVLLLTAVLLPLLVNANPIEINGIWYYFSSEGNNVFVSSAPDGTKYVGSIDIPSVITYGDAVYNVTGIRASAFAHCDKLTSVIVPEGVTKIGQGAFYNCVSLNSISIPESLVEIKDFAFLSCTSLKRIVLPQNLKRIFEGAFAECFQLIEIYCYPQEVPSINARTFDESCLKVATLYVPLGAIEAYRTTAPWSNFGTIKALEEIKASEKCEAPTISYIENKIVFVCDTEGATIKSCTVANDTGERSESEFNLIPTYTITAYATKENYEDSDVATLTLCWIPCIEEHESEEDGILTIPSKPVLIQSQGGTITLSGLADDIEVVAYDLAGELLDATTATGDTATLTTNLNQGDVVILKIGNNSIKIVVK